MRCKDEKKNYFGEFASSQLVKQYYRRWFLREKMENISILNFHNITSIQTSDGTTLKKLSLSS